MKESILLEIDGLGNVLLGLPLIVYPAGIARLLGLPFSEHAFYPVILGALLVGLGIALLIERFSTRIRGLGLGGILSINLTFGVVLALWLIASPAALPVRGAVLLWVLVLVLVGISGFEVFSLTKPKST